MSEAQQLNHAFKNPFNSTQLLYLWRLVQGHPHLLRLLFLHRFNPISQIDDYSSLLDSINEQDGVLSDHLNTLLKRMKLNPGHNLIPTMRQILQGQRCSDHNAVLRLLSLGVIRWSEDVLLPANQVYQRFFSKSL